MPKESIAMSQKPSGALSDKGSAALTKPSPPPPPPGISMDIFELDRQDRQREASAQDAAIATAEVLDKINERLDRQESEAQRRHDSSHKWAIANLIVGVTSAIAAIVGAAISILGLFR